MKSWGRHFFSGGSCGEKEIMEFEIEVMSHVENEMSKMNLPETVPAVA